MADVTMSGPLFDGRARAALAEYLHVLPEKVGEKGQQMVREHLNTVLKQNLGVYVGAIRVMAAGLTAVIDDSGIVYGPWLEGIEERNLSTRFKGYRTFRIVTGQLNARAEGIAEGILQPYLARME